MLLHCLSSKLCTWQYLMDFSTINGSLCRSSVEVQNRRQSSPFVVGFGKKGKKKSLAKIGKKRRRTKPLRNREREFRFPSHFPWANLIRAGFPQAPPKNGTQSTLGLFSKTNFPSLSGLGLSLVRWKTVTPFDDFGRTNVKATYQCMKVRLSTQGGLSTRN